MPLESTLPQEVATISANHSLSDMDVPSATTDISPTALRAAADPFYFFQQGPQSSHPWRSRLLRRVLHWELRIRAWWTGLRSLPQASCLCIGRNDTVVIHTSCSIVREMARGARRSHFHVYLLVVALSIVVSIVIMMFGMAEGVSGWLAGAAISLPSMFFLAYQQYREEEEQLRREAGLYPPSPPLSQQLLVESALTSGRAIEDVLRDFLPVDSDKSSPSLCYQSNHFYSTTTARALQEVRTSVDMNEVVSEEEEEDDIFPRGEVAAEELARRRSLFEEFSCADLSEGERSFAVDRRSSHTFQVMRSCVSWHLGLHCITLSAMAGQGSSVPRGRPQDPSWRRDLQTHAHGKRLTTLNHFPPFSFLSPYLHLILPLPVLLFILLILSISFSPPFLSISLLISGDIRSLPAGPRPRERSTRPHSHPRPSSAARLGHIGSSRTALPFHLELANSRRSAGALVSLLSHTAFLVLSNLFPSLSAGQRRQLLRPPS